MGILISLFFIYLSICVVCIAICWFFYLKIIKNMAPLYDIKFILMGISRCVCERMFNGLISSFVCVCVCVFWIVPGFIYI